MSGTVTFPLPARFITLIGASGAAPLSGMQPITHVPHNSIPRISQECQRDYSTGFPRGTSPPLNGGGTLGPGLSIFRRVPSSSARRNQASRQDRNTRRAAARVPTQSSVRKTAAWADRPGTSRAKTRGPGQKQPGRRKTRARSEPDKSPHSQERACQKRRRIAKLRERRACDHLPDFSERLIPPQTVRLACDPQPNPAPAPFDLASQSAIFYQLAANRADSANLLECLWTDQKAATGGAGRAPDGVGDPRG